MESKSCCSGKCCSLCKIITTILVLLIVAGGAYYLGAQNAKVSETSPTTTTTSNAVIPTSTSTTSPSDTTGATQSSADTKKNITIVYGNSTTFTDKEKKDLDNKFINPLVAYGNNGTSFYGSPIDSIVIDKYTPSASYVNYEYSINIKYKGSVVSGMLWGEKINGELQYWIPGCMGLCNFTENFISQYPEVIKAYVIAWNKENKNQPAEFTNGKVQLIKK